MRLPSAAFFLAVVAGMILGSSGSESARAERNVIASPVLLQESWLIILDPTEAFSLSGEVLWVAQPGERYRVLGTDGDWVLAVWESEGAQAVWFRLDPRVDFFAGPVTPPPPPSPPAVPPAGSVLYTANWSGGMAGWTGTQDWKTVGGMLVNDGTGGNSLVIAPFQPPTSDYAVEADFQVLGLPSDRQVGIVIRREGNAGYGAGVWHNNPPSSIRPTGVMETYLSAPGGALMTRTFDPGRNWHTYRFEAQGNNLRLLIDGTRWLQATDNRFLSPGEIALRASTQASFRSFKIIQL